MFYLTELKDAMDAIDPRLFYLAIALIVWGLVYAWRKFAPKTFEVIPPQLQALPAIMLSAVLGAAGDAESLKQAVLGAVLGLFSGLIAIGGHHVLKAAPGPYHGAGIGKSEPKG